MAEVSSGQRPEWLRVSHQLLPDRKTQKFREDVKFSSATIISVCILPLSSNVSNTDVMVMVMVQILQFKTLKK